MSTKNLSKLWVNPRGLTHSGGVARWAMNVLQELPKFQEFHLIKPLGIESKSHFVTRASENFLIPIIMSKNDILLSLCNWGPIIKNQAIVIHDVAPLVYPEFFKNGYVYFSREILPRLIQKSSYILTVSEFTKREIIRIFDVDAESITVVGASSTLQKFSKGMKDTDNPIIISGEKYMLFIGAHDPRKNLNFILKFWHEIYAQTGTRLIVIGRRDGRVFPNISSKEMLGVTFLEQVSDGELKYLISNAICLLNPSIYEGFGLPIIESLLMGTPVISSKTGIAEDIKSIGLQIFELDIDQWKTAIKNHVKHPFYFEWNSWSKVAQNIAQSIEL